MMRCRLIRALAARRLDDGVELPGWIRRHHAACPSCRASFERERACAEQLAHAAAQARVPSPRFLRQRILANLEGWRDEPASVRPHWPHPWAVAASLAALVVAYVMVLGSRSIPDRAGHDLEAPREALAALQRLPGGATVLSFGARLDAPLDGELQLVVDDARSALAALSRSFLPADRTIP